MPHQWWDRYSNPVVTSYGRFDLHDSSYALLLMADQTPAWREVYSRIGDGLASRDPTYRGAIDWLTQIGDDPRRANYPEQVMAGIPERLRGNYNRIGWTANLNTLSRREKPIPITVLKTCDRGPEHGPPYRSGQIGTNGPHITLHGHLCVGATLNRENGPETDDRTVASGMKFVFSPGKTGVEQTLRPASALLAYRIGRASRMRPSEIIVRISHDGTTDSDSQRVDYAVSWSTALRRATCEGAGPEQDTLRWSRCPRRHDCSGGGRHRRRRPVAGHDSESGGIDPQTGEEAGAGRPAGIGSGTIDDIRTPQLT